MPGTVDFKAIFNRAPNPYMLLDRELKFVDANEAYMRATSSRREDLLGRYVFDVFPGAVDDPENRSAQQFRRSLERVLTTRQPDTIALIRYAVPVASPEGTTIENRYWSATHTPLLGETGEVVHILQHTVDVTELQALKQAVGEAGDGSTDPETSTAQVEGGIFRRAQVVQEVNLRLDAEQRRLRRLFEQAPGFIAVVRGPEHVFEIANAAYRQMVGHRDIIGKPVREALPEVEGQGFFELLDEVYTTGRPFVGREMAIYVERAPGAPLDEVFLDFIYQSIVEPDGSVSGIFVQGHDVTEQKRTRDALQDLNETLELRVAERTAELEARNRELQEFAYVASHDLQEPLRKVHSFIDLFLDEYPALEGDGRFYLDRIQSAAMRMSRLIKDLLSYSRIATHSAPFQTVDLNDIARAVLADLRVQVEETAGVVEVGPLPEIEADPGQMRQLFQNLIENGLKFHHPERPPVIRVRAAAADQDDGRPVCRLAFEDDGIGLAASYADRIFMPFQRLHTRDKYPGTGIGLAICRRIAERHEGAITVQSTPGEGATFVVELPVRQRTAPSPSLSRG